ncbi:hypothetical protein GCM10023231_12560 [Olivibacter ginsenosidimutans]|uniref:Uncharacterized protein n=1 Tax=Olivibacter ginsenosidimutans TaxID=1176537 RepID=A0ABP9AUK7_9SPHI
MHFKKITGTVLVAVMLSGGTISVAKVRAERAANAARADQEWLYDDSLPGADPTQPEFYHQGSTSGCSSTFSEVCGITAPVDENSDPENPKPEISEDLIDQMQGNATPTNVRFKP